MWKKISSFFSIAICEGRALFCHIIPASFQWWYQVNSKQNISFYLLSSEKKSKAYLYLYGKRSDLKKERPVLFLHGDFSHPFTLLHFAKSAKKRKHPIFYLHIPKIHRHSGVEDSLLFLKKAIKIILMLGKKEKASFSDILAVGHSKGAILLAYEQFVLVNPRIYALFSIAGRLHVPEGDESCVEELRPFIRKLSQSMHKQGRKITQIIPKEDWNAPYEAMTVPTKTDCYLVEGMHLSALYSEETEQEFQCFLKRGVLLSSGILFCIHLRDFWKNCINSKTGSSLFLSI